MTEPERPTREDLEDMLRELDEIYNSMPWIARKLFDLIRAWEIWRMHRG